MLEEYFVKFFVYFRYHKPNSSGSTVKVHLETPRIFAQCEGKLESQDYIYIIY